MKIRLIFEQRLSLIQYALQNIQNRFVLIYLDYDHFSMVESQLIGFEHLTHRLDLRQVI